MGRGRQNILYGDHQSLTNKFSNRFEQQLEEQETLNQAQQKILSLLRNNQISSANEYLEQINCLYSKVYSQLLFAVYSLQNTEKEDDYLTEQEVSSNIFTLLKASDLSQDKDEKDIRRVSFILEEKNFLNEYQEMYYYETIDNVNQSISKLLKRRGGLYSEKASLGLLSLHILDLTIDGGEWRNITIDDFKRAIRDLKQVHRLDYDFLKTRARFKRMKKLLSEAKSNNSLLSQQFLLVENTNKQLITSKEIQKEKESQKALLEAAVELKAYTNMVLWPNLEVESELIKEYNHSKDELFRILVNNLYKQRN
jgi:hypothetical protein